MLHGQPPPYELQKFAQLSPKLLPKSMFTFPALQTFNKLVLKHPDILLFLSHNELNEGKLPKEAGTFPLRLLNWKNKNCTTKQRLEDSIGA